jgi:DNA-binding MarR family transcriptional regulator
MRKKSMARGAGTATKQAPKPDSAQYDNIDTIEAAWLEQRLQEISRTVGLQTGELYVLLALRRSGKPYELRPTDLFRALLVTSGAMTKRVARLQEGGFILRVSANDDGRSELVRLTAKGLATADRGITEIAKVVERVTEASALTKAEIAALDRCLRKLLAVKTVKATSKTGRLAAAG